MPAFLMRIAILAGVLLALSACGNAPQQPSDVVDDQAAESPYQGQNESGEDSDSSTDFSDLGTTPSPATDPVVTGALPAPPADLTAVSGRWAPVDVDCGTAGAVVTISSTRFESLERMCDISDTISAGGDSITATLLCTGSDGQTDSELVKLTPSEDTLQLNYVGGAEPPATLTRCP